MRISKSQYISWEFCPRAYKYVHLDKLPFIPTIPMQLGSSFHDFAHNYFYVFPFPELHGLTDPQKIKDVFASTAAGIECPTGIAKYADNFVRFEYERYMGFVKRYENPVLWYEPLLLEEKYVATDAFPESDVTIDLVGIIDRIDPTELSEDSSPRNVSSIATIEYKTGNLSQRVLTELGFYALLLEKHNERLNEDKLPPVTHFVAYSPVKNETIIEINQGKIIARVANRILKMAKDVEEGIFPYRENPFCSTCAGIEPCMESDISREMILQMCKEAAYTPAELSTVLNVRPGTVKGVLSDMYLEGLIKRGYKGNIVYWWVE